MAARRPYALGVVLCLGAGIAFAIQPVLGQLAFDRGAAVAPLLGSVSYTHLTLPTN